MTEQSPNQQPSQPQQPGGYQQPAEAQYSGAPYQQQYASPQAQYQAQYAQYPQGGAGQLLDKLPFNTMTAGLAGGGVVAMVVAVLLAASGEGTAVALVLSQVGFEAGVTASGAAPGLFTLFIATVVLTAITLSTEKLRPLFRMILLGLAAAQFSNAIATVIIEAEPENDGAAIFGMLLYLAAVGLLVAASFTVTKPQAPGVPATQQPQGPYAQPGQTGQQPQVQQTQTQWPQAPQA